MFLLRGIPMRAAFGCLTAVLVVGLGAFDGATLRALEVPPPTAPPAVAPPRAAPRVTGSLLRPPPRESLDITDFAHQACRTFFVFDGIPSNDTTQIAFDQRGYVFVGALNGGGSYDGRSWTRFNMPNRDRSNRVTVLLPSRDGGMWFGTQAGGLGYRKDDAWRVVADRSSGLPSDAVGAMLETADGEGATVLWVGTNQGLARYTRGEWTTFDLFGVGRNAVHALAESAEADGSRGLWVATTGGVARLAHETWTYWDTASGLPGDSVSTLIVSKDGTGAVWAFTSAGLARFDRGQWGKISTPDALIDNRVNAMIETIDNAGVPAIWIATEGEGLGRYANGEWAIMNVTGGELPTLGVMSLLETVEDDGTPVLWVGTGTGLVRYRRGIWMHMRQSDLGLRDTHTRAIAAEPGPYGTRAIWVAQDSGLTRLSNGAWKLLDISSGIWSDKDKWLQVVNFADLVDGDSQEYWFETPHIKHFARGEWSYVSLTSNRPTPYSMCAVRDESGALAVWFGSRQGLLKLANGRFTLLRPSPDPARCAVLGLARSKTRGSAAFWLTTPAGYVRYESGVFTPVGFASGPLGVANALFELEAGDGEIWLGTDGGLVRVRGDEKTVFDTSTGLPDNRVRQIAGARGRDGTLVLWLLTDTGISRFEGGRVTTYGPEHGLPDGSITRMTLLPSRSGGHEVWAIMRSAGVVWLDVDDPESRWHRLSDSTVPALRTNSVIDICRDRRGATYLATEEGVARLTPRRATPDDPAPFSLVTYMTEDGLPFWGIGILHVDGRGRIWAGGLNGAAVFDPEAETHDSAPAPLYVKDVRADSLDQRVSNEECLDYDQNTLDFQFALLNFTRGEDSRFRSQLVGFDPEPSEWTADAKRRYTNLPAGDFTFRVWGRDYAGNVAGPAEFRFTIRPAPWRTWWAYTLYVLTLGALAFAVMQYRLRALRARGRELEALVARRTEELAASEHRALAANHAKSAFLATMSHELRTPLNAVLGFAQLMDRDHELPSRHRGNLSVIQRSGEHLLGLIDDVLSISKIEAGELRLSESVFDLRRMLDGMEAMIRVRAQGKGLEVAFEVDEGLPRHVRGDEGKLRQVLLNLLGNAVKFTQQGGVTLRARWADARAHFEVADTGPGISEQEQGRLFEAFAQTETGRRAAEGTGLGLAISRRMVELMGGEVWVRSREGEGSVFGFDVALPAAEDEAERERPRRVIGLAAGEPRPRILVADDTAENRALLRTLLEAVGFDVREATNGQEAVDVWSEWRPAAIFMDIRMPVLDGREAARRIRAEEKDEGGRMKDESEEEALSDSSFIRHPSSFTRIVALTASAFEHEREEILAAGCDEMVTKPYREERIFEVLGELLGVRYEYEDADDEQAAGGEVLRTERFAAVPENVVAALRAALADGDDAAALAMVERVRAVDEELARAVAERLRRFEFDEILAAMGGAS